MGSTHFTVCALKATKVYPSFSQFPRINYFLKKVYLTDANVCHTLKVNRLTASPQKAGKQKGACAQLQIRRGRPTSRLNGEAKRARGRHSPATTATEAVERLVLPAQAPSTSAAVPPVKPAAAVSSCSAAQTELRSPGHCSSGAL